MNIDGIRFSVLTALAAGPQHGYGILQDVTDLSDEGTAPPVGSLYRVLDRLAEEGYVGVAREDVVGGRFRRYYELTELGTSALAEAAALRVRTADEALARLRKRRAKAPKHRGALA